MKEVKGPRRSKKSKSPNKRPAKVRYWAGRHLERNKVKNLMRHCGMTRAEATDFWQKSRGNRRIKVA